MFLAGPGRGTYRALRDAAFRLAAVVGRELALVFGGVLPSSLATPPTAAIIWLSLPEHTASTRQTPELAATYPCPMVLSR